MSAAASDKARFYLEKTVPELQEYERKGIFSKAEIISITKKRSEFEHLINMRPKPSDFARYAQFEMNLDSLRKKRSKRTGVKATSFTGQKKIMFILERGTRRFQGDLALWMQYLEYCKQEGARKKLQDSFTRCLRMHPLQYEIWIWVAKMYYEEQSDMANARNYMQRGLRFCKRERRLWLEYAKLELVYLAKLDARNEILGLKVERAPKKDDDTTEMDTDADVLALPDVTAEELEGEKDQDAERREAELKKVVESPALSGAIPQVIFDSAMREFNNDPLLAEQFFDVFASFPNLPCTGRLVQHLLDHLVANPDRVGASRVSLTFCGARRELFGMDPEKAASDDEYSQFPVMLAKFLENIRKGMGPSPILNASLAEKTVLLLLQYHAADDDLIFDDDILRVLGSAIKRYLRILIEGPTKIGGDDKITVLGEKLRKEGKYKESNSLLEFATQLRPEKSQELRGAKLSWKDSLKMGR